MSESKLDQAEVEVPHRKLWVIILFMIFGGPLAFAYCGRLAKGVLWQLGFLAFGLLAMAGMLYTPWTRLFLGLLAIGALLFYLAVFVTTLGSRQQLPWRPYQKWWCYGLLCLAFASFSMLSSAVVRNYWSEAFHIPANSMRETILSGDRILVEKLIFKAKGPQRNSLIVFRTPDRENSPSIVVVKRLIALPGDRILIQDGVVYVNDQKLEEPYAKYLGELDPNAAKFLQEFSEQTVPVDHYFLVGDNRWNSLDSRYYGFVPAENLIGETKAVFWSREYELIYPTRENPQGGEKVGSIRWERIGKRFE